MGQGQEVQKPVAKPATATAAADVAPRPVIWPEIMTVAVAAKYLKISKSTLNNYASRRRPEPDAIPFFYIGRARRYRKADLDAWIQRRIVRSTHEWDGKRGKKVGV